MQILDRTTKHVLGICALIYAVSLPLMLWLQHDYVPVARPQGQIVESIGRIAHVEGFAYQAPTGIFLRYLDNDPENQHSPIVLYENLTPLGPAHSSQADVQFIGRGRYSHWGNNSKPAWRPINGVIFSASDNSDPRTNGRHYWAVLPDANAAPVNRRTGPM